MYDAVVAEGQRWAESRMLDTFSIERSLGFVYDPLTQAEVEQFEPLFTTPGRVKSAGVGQVSEGEAGARPYIESRRELHIPVGSPPVPAGAVARCTAVDNSTDPNLLGAVLRLPGAAPGSQTTARRLIIEEGLS